MSWKATAELSNMIKHYATFPATGVSLRQMYAFEPAMEEDTDQPTSGIARISMLT